MPLQYGVLSAKGHWYINFLLFTEVTNIGQHARVLIDHLGLKESPIRAMNGVLWAVSFLVIRIVPIPYVLWQAMIVGQNLSTYGMIDHVLTSVTVPI